jgi:hypothetical protein
MSKTSKTEALNIAKTLFEALAPLLVEHGVTSSEAEALLRAAVVHEAARISKQYGQRPNASQVSIKTGVDRHVVSGLLKTPLAFSSAASARRDSTSRVLDGWLSDAEYSRNNRPRALPIGDPQSKGNTAWSLVQRYAPGVWPRLVIDELIRLNYVDVLAEGILQRKRMVVRATAPRLVRAESSTQLLCDLIQSLVEFQRRGRRRTWRTAQSVRIGRSKVPLVRKMIQDRLDSTFAELAEELGSTRWKPQGAESGRDAIIGVNAFTFERRTTDSVRRGEFARGPALHR